MLWETISKKLSEKNWTIYKLCLKAGIGTAGIYRLRDGVIKDLQFETVKKIADALEVSLDEFRQKGANMNELERTALNEILRTVTYIAEKLDELDTKISLSDLQVLEHQEN